MAMELTILWKPNVWHLSNQSQARKYDFRSIYPPGISPVPLITMVQWPQLQPAKTPAAVVKNRKSPSTRRRNKKRRQLYLESKRGGPTSGQAPQSFETHSKVTASDPRRVNQEVAEVEENWEVYTGKALVTGTNDTTNFNSTTENPDTAIP